MNRRTPKGLVRSDERNENGKDADCIPRRSSLGLSHRNPYEEPLGGSQSALCYLAEALARLGHEVSLLNQCTRTVVSRGVQCLPLRDFVAYNWLHAQDAVIALNSPVTGKLFREHIRRPTRLILWSQHDIDQVMSELLAEPGYRDAFDAFVLVSEWQRQSHSTPFRGLDLLSKIFPPS